MQPYTLGEKLVVVVIACALTGGTLAGAGVETTWWGSVCLGLLVGLVVAGYCALYNAVLSR